MRAMVNKKAVEGYGHNAIQSELDYASPHRIIQMLMDGAISKISAAKGCLKRNDVQGKSRQITWAMNIILGLQSSLDAEKGGSVAENLNALYDYMGRQLLAANVNNDEAILDEILGLLTEVKSGWDGIPSEFH